MPESKRTVSLEETEEMEKARELVKLAIYELKDRGYDYHLSMITVLNTVLDYIYNHSCGEDDEEECSGYIVEAAFDLLGAKHAKETNKVH